VSAEKGGGPDILALIGTIVASKFPGTEKMIPVIGKMRVEALTPEMITVVVKNLSPKLDWNDTMSGKVLELMHRLNEDDHTVQSFLKARGLAFARHLVIGGGTPVATCPQCHHVTFNLDT